VVDDVDACRLRLTDNDDERRAVVADRRRVELLKAATLRRRHLSAWDAAPATAAGAAVAAAECVEYERSWHDWR